jgi:hypothetical protein
MWSVGGEVKFGKGHGQDAKRGLELGIERATAAIARGTTIATTPWQPKAPEDPKARWRVDGDGARVDPSNRALDAHLRLESMVPRVRASAARGGGGGGGGGGGAGGEESDSSSLMSDSSATSDEIRKLRRAGNKRRRAKEASGGGGGGKKSSKKDKSSKKEKKEKKEKKSKKSSKRKSGKRRRSSSGSDSDSDSDARGVDFVSGKKIKMKLEGSSKRDDVEAAKRAAYLRSLNAQISFQELTK